MNNLAQEISSKIKVNKSIETYRFEDVLSSNMVLDDDSKTEGPSVDQSISTVHKIKIKILKPIYSKLANISPRLAEKIRIYIYRFWDMFLSRKINKKNNIKIQENKHVNLLKERILIDVTEINKYDSHTGIQRVVRNIALGLLEKKENIILVRDYNGKLITCNEYLTKLIHKEFDGIEYYVNLHNMDKLFLLDSSWSYYADFRNILRLAQKKNIKSYVIIHDLIPLQYPETVDGIGFKIIFEKWHRMVLEYCSDIICVSKTTADYVEEYFSLSKIKRQSNLNLYSFILGSNFKVMSEINTKYIRPLLRKMFDQDTFLMVGTIEPRKGYLVAVKAITSLLDKGYPIKLLIIGKKGWACDAFIETLRNNNYYNKQIVWINDASDVELAWAYKNAKALIAASKQEGFGLPLVEAAQYNLPIICSDIAVFREVTHNSAQYFNAFDIDDLSNKLEFFLKNKEVDYAVNIPQITWEDSTNMILDILEDKKKPYKVLR